MPSVRDRPWRRSTGPTSSLRARLSRSLWAAARLVWAVALAYEKRGKLHALTRARNRGLVVVCDRYPQNQFQDFNDGPMLGRWRDHPWRDRKSTRLNSSHLVISYAVFCLEKKRHNT